MTPRQPVECKFNARCQIQPRRVSGKMRRAHEFLQPLLVMSWGFLFALNNIGRAELPLDRCGNIWAAQHAPYQKQKGRDAALRRPVGAARRPYQLKYFMSEHTVS